MVLGTFLVILAFIPFLFYWGLDKKTSITSRHPLVIVVFGPLLEEVLFRVVIVALLGASIEIGILSSLIFGLLHSCSVEGKWKVNLNLKDPHWIIASIAGFWYWYVYVNYGFVDSLSAHILVNWATWWIFMIWKPEGMYSKTNSKHTRIFEGTTFPDDAYWLKNDNFQAESVRFFPVNSKYDSKVLSRGMKAKLVIEYPGEDK